MPIEYFFEDMPPEITTISAAANGRGKAKKLPGYAPDIMVKRETLELVRAYYRIEDADVRKGVYQLTKAMGAGVSGRLREIGDIVKLVADGEPKPGKRGPYNKHNAN